jgi:hypothetical protein
VPGASSEPGDGTGTLVHANGESADLGRHTELAGTGAERQFGAIKSVASDVHAPHPVSSRRGELTSSAGMPELLLRRSAPGQCSDSASTTLSKRVMVGRRASVKES